LTEIITPHPAVGEAATGEVAAADASFDLVGHGDAHEVAMKATEEAPARAEAREPSEPAARDSSSPEPAPSAQTIMPTTGTGIGTAAGPLLFGAASDSDGTLQGPLTVRAVGSDRSGAS
jgi:hypothetical protein